MGSCSTSRRDYSRAERITDAAVHVAGLALALLGVPILVTLAVSWRGDPGTVMAASLYGATLLAMIGCSALYNMTHGCAWTGVFRRMDHTAIYLKIAGTYTPFAVLSGAQAGPLLVTLWGAAAVGAALKVFAPDRFKLTNVALCLGMGWAGIFLAEDLVAGLSPETFALLVTGGLLYTAGVVFFLWVSLPFHYTIWHVFVLVATCVFYAAVIVQLGHGPVGLTGAESPAHLLLHHPAGAG
jgi:hemolysin III